MTHPRRHAASDATPDAASEPALPAVPLDPGLLALTAAALEAASDAIGILRPVTEHGSVVDAEIVFLNAAARRRWYGDRTNAQLRGLRLFVELPALRAAMVPLLERAVTGDGDARGRHELDTPGGPQVVDSVVSAFGDHLIHVCRDVTIDHREAAASRASEERLRVTIEGVDAAISYRAPGEPVPSISGQIERILGRPPEDVAPYEAWIDLIHPDDLPSFDATHQGADASWDITYRMRHADGHWVWVSDRGRRLGGNPDGGAWGVITDVSASRAASEQFHAVFEENPESIALFRPVLDERGELVDAECLAMNRVARSHYLDGRQAGAAAGVRVARDLGFAGVLLEPLRDTHRTGRPFRGELRVAEEPEERWSDISIFPYDDGFAVVGRDTTTERAVEARLEHAQRLEALGQLAGGVAHDFNNLLAAMRGYGQFVLDTLPEGTGARPDMEQVLRAVDRASALTRQLLMFSRRQTVAPQVIDPLTVIGEAAAMLRRLVGEHIEVVTKLPPGLGHVLADPGELERALVNLAVNARDAMPDGGCLSIAATHADVAVQDGRSVPALRMTISDTGCGMDAATLSHIFEPFFTTKPVGQGTGLGLSAVYGFVQASGGDVRVWSRPGAGTTFTIDLPLVDLGPDPARPAVPAATGDREKVLVVEDDPSVLALTSRILVSLGYEATRAATGTAALELIEQGFRPALLLSDVRMPGIQGPQLAVAARRALPGLPVLLVSGFADAFDPSEAGLADVRVVQKPFTREELASAVRAALAR